MPQENINTPNFNPDSSFMNAMLEQRRREQESKKSPLSWDLKAVRSRDFSTTQVHELVATEQTQNPVQAIEKSQEKPIFEQLSDIEMQLNDVCSYDFRASFLEDVEVLKKV